MVKTEGPAGQHYPGSGLGLPFDGVGSVGSMARRIGAFVIDLVLSALVAWIFTAPEPPQNTSLLVWAVMTVAAVGLFGITPGQAVLGLRVVPPLLVNEDGRGLHDRLCRTIVLRIR